MNSARIHAQLPTARTPVYSTVLSLTTTVSIFSSPEDQHTTLKLVTKCMQTQLLQLLQPEEPPCTHSFHLLFDYEPLALIYPSYSSLMLN